MSNNKVYRFFRIRFFGLVDIWDGICMVILGESCFNVKVFRKLNLGGLSLAFMCKEADYIVRKRLKEQKEGTA